KSLIAEMQIDTCKYLFVCAPIFSEGYCGCEIGVFAAWFVPVAVPGDRSRGGVKHPEPGQRASTTDHHQGLADVSGRAGVAGGGGGRFGPKVELAVELQDGRARAVLGSNPGGSRFHRLE